MRVIRVAPDYECFPLWNATPGEVGNIDPRDLLISSTLSERLINWGEKFDTTLNHDDPVNSGFKSCKDEFEFISEGRELAKLLQDELGLDYSVVWDHG